MFPSFRSIHLMHSRLALLALALAIPATASAQSQRDTVELEEIVVTADRTPLPASRVVHPTTVISGAELRERGIRFVSDALLEVPGAMLVPSGSYGSQTSLFLRGGESDYVKVLVDGVAVNQPGGSFDFAHLTTDNVERVEITRGPGSVLYGSDAVAGVVQVFTRKGSGPLRADAAIRAGSFGSLSAEGSLHGGGEAMSYSAGLARFASDGIYDFNNSYRNTAASGALSVRPDDRTDLTLTARTGSLTAHYPTDYTGLAVDRNSHTLQDGTILGLDIGRRMGRMVELRALLASHIENDGAEDHQDSAADTSGLFASSSQGRLRRQSVDLRASLTPSERARLTLGTTVEHENLREATQSQFDFGFGPGTSADRFEAERRNTGVYAQAIVDATSRLLINLGSRLDDNARFGAHFTWRAGAIYGLRPGLRVRASIGTGFKEPSLRENFARAPFEVGNPGLDPERSRSWEIGLEQALLGGDVMLAGSWFDQRFLDLIQYNGNALPGATNYQNVAEATSRGLELQATIRPAASTIVSASYTWLRTRVEDAGFSTGPGETFVEGEPLLRRPAHSARLDARTRPIRRLSLGAALTYVGERDDVDFRPFPSVRTTLDAYATVDLDASFDLFRHRSGASALTGVLRVENLFDSDHVTLVGFPARGRSIQVGARAGL